MSSIDAVVAQARRPGTFTERKRFTVAKTQAIQKLRKFALADPFAYILELIQSAIANGALYIDIALDERSMTLSYVGGGIPEASLSRLFDFLFAAKDRVDLGYVRELALGVNALLLFAPAKVVIESGDGTREGTTRVELLAGGEKFDVGRPDHVLSGTFVRAEGMDRAKVLRELKRAGDPEHLYEQAIVETRCLAAPVPIVFNGASLFGYSTMRIPGLFGFERVVSFDEGDLYGAIGLTARNRPEFALLTRGVLIEALEHPLVEGLRIGGTVCFDALRKTADHARIVRDDRFEELWLRLRPHALQLTREGREGRLQAAVRVHGGPPLETTELRRLLRERGRAVVMPPDLGEHMLPWAEQIAAVQQAALLVVPPGQARALRILGGERVRVMEPDFSDRTDLAFFSQRAADPPPRPWLIEPIPAPALTTGQLTEAILAGADPADLETQEVRALLQGVLGDSGEVKATVYAPAAVVADALVVELRAFERVLHRAELDSSFAGLMVVVELPDLRPGGLRAIGLDAIAEAVARHASEALGEASRRVLEGMSVETCVPGDASARRALAAAARSAVLRLRGAGVELAPLEAGPPGVDLLGLPLLRTLGGAPLSLRELVRRAREETFGLVYGAVPGVPPDLEGLDAGKIVGLDAASERNLLALVGESVYVRVDARQECARHRGVVCRDIALGLRAYPEFPLLVEGTDPSGWPEAEREACLDALLEQLLAVVRGASPSLAGLPDGDAAELRRHALRHLQWFSLHAPTSRLEWLGHVPLARCLDGAVYSAEAVLGRLAAGGPLWVHCWHGPFPGAGEEAGAGEPGMIELTPLVYQLLAGHEGLRAGFDFDVGIEDVPQGMADGAGPKGYLASAPVRLAGVEGTIGAPADEVAAPAVIVYDAARRRAHVFAELGSELGVAGVLRSTRPSWGDGDAREVAAAIVAAADGVYRELVRRIFAAPAGSPEGLRGLVALLFFAGRHLQLAADPAGRVRATVTSGTAEHILEQPLFPGPHGVPRSGWRVVQAACEALSRGEALAPLAGQPVLREFCELYLGPARVARPATRGAAAAVPVPREAATIEALGAALERWLHALRPDHPGLPWKERGRVRLLTGELALRLAGAFGDVDGEATTWTLFINGTHWLVEEALTGSPQALAWLLFACYSRINEVFPAVTRDHELEFQRRVVESLLAGELG